MMQVTLDASVVNSRQWWCESITLFERNHMSNEALKMRGHVHGTKDAKRVAIGSGVGAVIETYDFIGFGTAAALYFGTAFFPTGDPVTGTLAAFATLGVGFAARPLGGIIGGHLGDKVGRKPVLVTSLILMGVATFLIGLLPTYSQVGLLAPARSEEHTSELQSRLHLVCRLLLE